MEPDTKKKEQSKVLDSLSDSFSGFQEQSNSVLNSNLEFTLNNEDFPNETFNFLTMEEIDQIIQNFDESIIQKSEFPKSKEPKGEGCEFSDVIGEYPEKTNMEAEKNLSQTLVKKCEQDSLFEIINKINPLRKFGNKLIVNLEIVNLDVYPPRNLDQVKQKLTKQAKKISMNQNFLGNDLCALIKEINPQELIYLSLESDHIDDEGVKILLCCDFTKLTHLYLANNHLEDEYSFEKGKWQALSVLSLSCNSITEKGIVSFGEYFPKLTSLTLRGNPIGDTGFKKLLSDNLPNLESLHIQNCQITSSLDFLTLSGQQPTQLTKLSKLYLGNFQNKRGSNCIRGNCFKNLINSCLSKNLKVLTLDRNGIGKREIELLTIHAERFPNLISLDLSFNRLTFDKIRPLERFSLGNLRYLYLKYNDFDVIKGILLLSRANLPSLSSLNIEGNRYHERYNCKMKALLRKTFSKGGRFTRVVFRRPLI